MMAVTSEFIWGAMFLMIVVGTYLHIIRALRELHLSTNSRLDELLTTTRDLAHAEGFAEGREDNKQERFRDIERASHEASPRGGG